MDHQHELQEGLMSTKRDEYRPFLQRLVVFVYTLSALLTFAGLFGSLISDSNISFILIDTFIIPTEISAIILLYRLGNLLLSKKAGHNNINSGYEYWKFTLLAMAGIFDYSWGIWILLWTKPDSKIALLSTRLVAGPLKVILMLSLLLLPHINPKKLKTYDIWWHIVPMALYGLVEILNAFLFVFSDLVSKSFCELRIDGQSFVPFFLVSMIMNLMLFLEFYSRVISYAHPSPLIVYVFALCPCCVKVDSHHPLSNRSGLKRKNAVGRISEKLSGIIWIFYGPFMLAASIVIIATPSKHESWVLLLAPCFACFALLTVIISQFPSSGMLNWTEKDAKLFSTAFLSTVAISLNIVAYWDENKTGKRHYLGNSILQLILSLILFIYLWITSGKNGRHRHANVLVPLVITSWISNLVVEIQHYGKDFLQCKSHQTDVIKSQTLNKISIVALAFYATYMLSAVEVLLGFLQRATDLLPGYEYYRSSNAEIKIDNKLDIQELKHAEPSNNITVTSAMIPRLEGLMSHPMSRRMGYGEHRRNASESSRSGQSSPGDLQENDLRASEGGAEISVNEQKETHDSRLVG
ncbi:hypothetical protein AAMO2058_000924300 [Amorphochlora amoebiformis]